MANPSTVKTIYKYLLHEATALLRTPQFRFRNTLRLDQWGTSYYVPPRGEYPHSTPFHWRTLQDYQQAQAKGFRYDDHFEENIVETIRQCFKKNMNLTDRKRINAKLDDAIHALRELSVQLLLAQSSSGILHPRTVVQNRSLKRMLLVVTVTNGIRIEATSQYNANPLSSPDKSNLFRYMYRITITNQNTTDAIQITGRQYTFTSVNGQVQSLPRHSPGIVGATPILRPGQSFEYTSGVEIDAPQGYVTGCLHAVRKKLESKDDHVTDGDHVGNQVPLEFDAYVSKFNLLVQRQ